MQTDFKAGLTAAQVKERVSQGLLNTPVRNPSKSVKQIILSNVFTYFNFIFAVLAVLLIGVGSYENLTFLPIVICNMLIGIIQEIRSKRVLDRLTVLNAPTTSVLREGAMVTVLSEELVQDDIVSFRAGNQITADAVVRDGEIRVNEALLTGEADEVVKGTGDSLLSGSFVISGECLAQLTQVGDASYASRLTLAAKVSKKGKQSEMMRSLDKLVLVIGIAMIPMGLALFCEHFFVLGYTLQVSVVSMVAALVGMIPEGLYLLASVALVVSVLRLARQRVLVHELSCIETLARVDVLCVDKTGTITENVMRVHSVVPLEQNLHGETESLHQRISEYVANLSRDNITMEALADYFDHSDVRTARRTIPFSAVTKYSAVFFEDAVYVLGAPEFILREQYPAYRESIEEFSQQGYRVLVYARYYGETIADGQSLTEVAVPYAYILLSNPIRKDAAATFDYFESQGVEVKVISGDNPVTVASVAKEARVNGAERYIDASTLVTEEQIAEAVRKYAVFGRVSPEQKRKFVKALKAQGRTVAMTGDGVNDVLALKDADCSVAMASGSDAAANASQLVLLDSDFSCMPSVVLEGRRVINNIQRSASLFLIKNIFSVLLTLVILLLGIQYPLVPTQLSLLGIFTIGTPSFVLALQPDKNRIQGHFMTNVLLKALPAGLTDFIMLVAISLMGTGCGIAEAQISTISICVLLTVGFAMLLNVCRPFNALRAALCICMFGGVIFSGRFLRRIFALKLLGGHTLMITAVFSVAALVLLVMVYYLLEWIRKGILNGISKRKQDGCDAR